MVAVLPPEELDIECGELTSRHLAARNISCSPKSDPFNPCEDIMGYPILRVAVWFVVGASVFGNLSVIVVLTGIFRRLSVPKFLQLNLAIGDLFMGIYLAMLAFADITTVGSYFNYAIDWQHGLGCKLAGAASLFASQLSIFTLCVITFERYYTITYSIDLNMRLQLVWAARIMFLGWLYAFVSAMLPIFANISSYSKTSICLPLRITQFRDKLFLSILLSIDSGAFIVIFACYLKMYLLIIRRETEANLKERTVARRMAILVGADFACWAPIIFFSATALLGKPLINVTNSKILIVFFYPLNSVANPFLYVITTRQYRRDLNYLTGRWHYWRKSLFNRHHDSYYSQNAAYGAHQYSGNALNVHLGQLAAVTGPALVHQNLELGQTTAAHTKRNGIAARNGHYSPTASPSPVIAASGSSGSRAGKLSQLHQRVICTKASRGRYIIRHQILAEAQQTSSRSRQSASQARPISSVQLSECRHRKREPKESTAADPSAEVGVASSSNEPASTVQPVGGRRRLAKCCEGCCRCCLWSRRFRSPAGYVTPATCSEIVPQGETLELHWPRSKSEGTQETGIGVDTEASAPQDSSPRKSLVERQLQSTGADQPSGAKSRKCSCCNLACYEKATRPTFAVSPSVATQQADETSTSRAPSIDILGNLSHNEATSSMSNISQVISNQPALEVGTSAAIPMGEYHSHCGCRLQPLIDEDQCEGPHREASRSAEATQTNDEVRRCSGCHRRQRRRHHHHHHHHHEHRRHQHHKSISHSETGSSGCKYCHEHRARRRASNGRQAIEPQAVDSSRSEAPTKLESILKHPVESSAVGQATEASWSRFFRVGSLRSSDERASRSRDKKRVSIVEFHSG